MPVKVTRSAGAAKKRPARRSAKKPASSVAVEKAGSADQLGPKGQATRKLLNQTILELVNEKGYPNLRLKDICDRTGLTIGAFYFHYENKDRALEGVAVEAARDLFLDISSDIESKPLLEEFHLTIRDYQRGYSDPSRVGGTRMMRSMIPANAQVTEVYFAERAKVIDKLVEASSAERRKAGKRNGPERAVIEYLFCGLADFLELVYLRDDPALKKSAGATKTLAKRLASLWYDAVMNA